MGSVALWMQMSLDGFTEGPDHETEWPIVDEELCAAYLEQLSAMDAFLYGRKAYDIMSAFWPTADADPAISDFYVRFARLWKRIPKIVFSRTLVGAAWNTRVVRDDIVEEVRALKTVPDWSMALFGGTDTASLLIEHNLIDEYHIFVHPVLLGSGTPLFSALRGRADLRLVETRIFESAVVHLHYHCPNRPGSSLSRSFDRMKMVG